MNLKPTSPKAIAYLRVSTDRQEISMEVQEEKIRAYCKMRDFELVDVLKEPDVSGKTRLYDRPEGGKIPSLISNGSMHVVALKLDRLFRNTIDALTVSEEWLKRGVSLHIVDMSGQAIDTGSTHGRMFFTMLAAFAEMERGLISDRTIAALRRRKESGSVYCPKTPYGLSAVKGKLVENKEESATILLMRDMRNAGLGYRSIAKDLNNRGIRSKMGCEWHPYVISRILSVCA